MTDYLKELLEEQEEEHRNETELVIPRSGEEWWTARRDTAAETDVEKTGLTAGPGEGLTAAEVPERDLLTGRERGDRPAEEHLEEQLTGLAGMTGGPGMGAVPEKAAEAGMETRVRGLSMAGPGAAKRTGGSGTLYGQLRRSGAAAEYKGRAGSADRIIPLEKSGGEETAGLTPAELDLAFQRDARRYDGAFALY